MIGSLLIVYELVDIEIDNVQIVIQILIEVKVIPLCRVLVIMHIECELSLHYLQLYSPHLHVKV